MDLFLYNFFYNILEYNPIIFPVIAGVIFCFLTPYIFSIFIFGTFCDLVPYKDFLNFLKNLHLFFRINCTFLLLFFLVLFGFWYFFCLLISNESWENWIKKTSFWKRKKNMYYLYLQITEFAKSNFSKVLFVK